MRRTRRRAGINLILALSALATSGAAQAQPGNPAPHLDESEIIVVTGTRTPHRLADAPVETTVITREDIRRSAANNLTQLLRGVPGYTSTSVDDTVAFDNVRSSFRGFTMNSGANLILIDGRRSWGAGLGGHNAMNPTMNQVPVSMIERVEVVKGAASSLYGADAMAGVINIITRPVPAEPYISATASGGRYDVISSPGSTQAVEQGSRESWNFNANYGAPLGENHGFNLGYDFKRDEGSGRRPELAEVHTLRARSLSVLSSEWQLALDGRLDHQRVAPAPGLSNQRSYVRAYDTLAGGATLTREQEQSRLTTTLALQTQDAMSANDADRYMEGDYRNALLESVYTFGLGQHQVTLGAELRRDEVDLISTLGGEREYGVGATINNQALFVQDEVQLAEQRLTLIPGLRAERHSRYGHSLSPNLAAMYQLAQQTRLRGSLGRSFKSPTVQQLYMDADRLHSNREYLRANPDLQPETALSSNLSLEHHFDTLPLWMSAGLYRNDPRDLVVVVETGEMRNGLPVRTYDNLDRTRIQGLELAFLLGNRQQLYLQGSASWTDSEDRGTGPHRGNTLRYVPQYQVTLTPGWVSGMGNHGIQGSITRVGEQYQNDTNTQIIAAHTVVDVSAWVALGSQFNAPRLSLDVVNLTGSVKGERQLNRFRQGRSMRLSLTAEF